MKVLVYKLSFLIILSLLNTSNVFSQLSGQAKIDSLTNELPNMKEDTNAVKLLAELSHEYYRTNPNEGIKYGEQGLEVSKKLNWEEGKAKCYNSLGTVYSFGKSNYSKGLEYYHRSLEVNEKIGNKEGLASNLGNIGIIYKNQAEYDKALEYYHKALIINEELENKRGIANILGNIGIVYKNQTNYNKALEYYQKALAINEELENKPGLTLNLGNIGNLYYMQNNYQEALEYYKRSLNISDELGNKEGTAVNLGNIGKLYFQLSQDSVIQKSDNSLELQLNKELNLNRSIEFTKKAIEIYKEIGELHAQSIFLEGLAEAYLAKGDAISAYKTHKKYKQLQDSVFSIQKQKEIVRLETKRENELKDKEIELLKIEQENQEFKNNFMFGGLFLLLIVIGVIYRQRQRSEKLLLNVLPAKVANRLKKKEHPIADLFDNASIIFIDIVEFTKMSSITEPKKLVSNLNEIFSIFDKAIEKHGLEKIKTIGDSYMAVSGIPEETPDHAKRAALAVLDIKEAMENYKTSNGTEVHFRIGIDCGKVVAGVIGNKKFIYDLWSDAVNTASRMESSGLAGRIQITKNFKNELEKHHGDWNFEERGEVEIKGKGKMKTYFLVN